MSESGIPTKCLVKEPFSSSSSNDAEGADEDSPSRRNGFPIEQGGSSTEPSNFDMRCAEELGKAVTKNLQVDRRSDLRKWAHQFRLLRTKDNVAKNRIKEVLLWYVSGNWTDDFFPQAYSGKAFRDKFFDKIVPAMVKDKKRNPDQDTSTDEPGYVLTSRVLTDEELDNILKG